MDRNQRIAENVKNVLRAIEDQPQDQRNPMKWHYRCPKCNARLSINWEEREQKRLCEDCNSPHDPPSSSEQHDAWVDRHDWPDEMERTVYVVRGKTCTVPGCQKRADTLDHRRAWSKGGRTSVDNLFPMCEDHNQSKGDEDYHDWLARFND
jgi:hypothetical protein